MAANQTAQLILESLSYQILTIFEKWFMGCMGKSTYNYAVMNMEFSETLR
jgi:hypothetical protein